LENAVLLVAFVLIRTSGIEKVDPETTETSAAAAAAVVGQIVAVVVGE